MKATTMNLDRRTFLKGGLIASATAAAGMAFAGCSPDGAEAADESAEPTAATQDSGYANPDGIGIPVTPDNTEDVDVVVIGSGMGGHVAAILVKEQAPETNVVMLEKLSVLGGNTNYAETPEGFVNLTPEEGRKAALEELVKRNFVVDQSLYYAMRTQQGDNADWLFGKHGVQLVDYGTGNPMYEDGMGASAITTLSAQAEEMGIDVRTEARAFALVLDDEYTVTGVQYKDADDVVTQLNAKAVVIASGGMNTNADLLQYYCNVDLGKIMPLGAGQDGDGHLMVEQTAHGRTGLQTIDGFFAGIGTAEDPCGFDSDLNTAAGFQFTDMFVNQYGTRFTDESLSYNTSTVMLPTAFGQAVLSQRQAFSIFDASYVEKWENGEWQNGHNGFDSATKQGQGMEIASEIERVSGSDWFFQADTIEDLGAQLAEACPTFDVDAFVATVEAYNKAAAGDAEEEWGKPADFVWALETAPFYAAKLGMNSYNTNGGIHINNKAQVVDPVGTPIAGLYATGIATAGWDSQVYGMGSNQPVAIFCSCAAARHIVENVLGGSFADDWMGDIKALDTVKKA